MALAQQLEQLKKGTHLRYPSLLYTQQQAGDIELDTVYYIGMKGLKKLCQIDNEFAQFDSLMSLDKKGICRDLLSGKENQKINEELKKMLQLLSKYFNYEGTHQLLEYLLRNYEIHEYLYEELIVYFMQYHNHNIYIRLLQNIVDKQRQNEWGFLYEPVSRSESLSRDYLIRQMQLDYRILKKLISWGCLIMETLNNDNKENDDIIIQVEEQEFNLSQEDIRIIKMRQPKPLSFIFSILINISTNFESIRGVLSRLIGECLKCEEGCAFSYLLFQQQLFNSNKLYFTQEMLQSIAIHVYRQPQEYFIDLVALFYQFGIQTSQQMSINLLKRDNLNKNNGLLLIQIIKSLMNTNIPQEQLNKLVEYLTDHLTNDLFMDTLVNMMHPQLLDYVRPYLRQQDMKLFPKSNYIEVNADNIDKLIKEKEKFNHVSVANMFHIVDSIIRIYLKSHSKKVFNLLEYCIEVSQNQFPQAKVLREEQLIALFYEQNLDLSMLIQYMELDDNCSIAFLYSVHHDMNQLNQILSQQYSTKQEFYENCVSKYYDSLLYQQALIEMAYHLQEWQQLQSYIDQYEEDDEFINSKLDQLDIEQLLNLSNPLSIKKLKSIELDCNLFFNENLNELGQLKILLHPCSKQPQFILKLFLLYDALTQNQKELYIQLLNTVKFTASVTIDDEVFPINLLQTTLIPFIKNRMDKTFTQTLGNIKDQFSLFELQFVFLKVNEYVEMQFACMASILNKTKYKLDPTQIKFLLEYIEDDFRPEFLETYLLLLQAYNKPDYTYLQKKLFKLPIESASIINKYLNCSFPPQLKSQMIIYIYSQHLENKQIVVQEDLDFECIIKLLETPSLKIVNQLLELLSHNIQYLNILLIKKCFKMDCKFIYHLNQFIFEYIELHKCNLLEELKDQLQKQLINIDLNDQNQYFNISSTIKLIAKHTQFKLMKSAFNILNSFQLSLPILKIVIQALQQYNSHYFNTSLFAYYLAKLLTFNQNIEQYLPLFSPQQLWVLTILINSVELPKDIIQSIVEYLDKQNASNKLLYITAIAESLFYRTAKSQKQLKVKVSQKFKQFQTPYLEVSMQRSLLNKNLEFKYIKLRFAFTNLLNQIRHFNINKYLNQSDLNQQELSNFKSCIIHLSKFGNIVTKLQSLADKTRSELISEIKLDSLLQLIQCCLTVTSISTILLRSLNELLDQNVIVIKKSLYPLLIDLVKSMIEQKLTTDMLITLNYIYNIKQIAKALKEQSQELIKQLLSEEYDQMDQSLIINLFGLISQHDTYSYIPYLEQIQIKLITTYSQQLNKQIADVLGVEFKQQDQTQKNIKIVINEAQRNIIQNFKGLISKQHLLNNLILMLASNSQYQIILQNIEQRVIIEIIQDLFDKCQLLNLNIQYVKFLADFIQTCDSTFMGTCYMQITKLLMNAFDQIREQFIDQEIEGGIFKADEQEDQVIEAFLQLIVKITDVQLKKVYSTLIGWSKQNLISGYNYRKYRRIVFFKLSNCISDKLSQYFTKYYIYIYDAIINELITFHSLFYETPKQIALAKRQQDECDMHYKLELLLARHVLTSIQCLCQHDQDQFLDTEKFEKLCQPLAQMLDCPKINKYEPILGFIDEWISNTILGVFSAINDDYKWKDLHIQILEVVSRHAQKKNEISGLIAIGIVKLLQKLIDQLDDRYLVLMNDLIPYLLKLTQTNHNIEELEKRVKQLVLKLSQLSGEDIVAMLR